MMRSLRFFAEYSLAGVAGAAMMVAASSVQTSGRPHATLEAMSALATLAGVALQWVVMRRYVGWAAQWAFAGLVASSLAWAAYALPTWLLPAGAPSWPLRFALGMTLSQAVPAWAVLSSRTRRAWVWLCVPAAAWLLAHYAQQALGLSGPHTQGPTVTSFLFGGVGASMLTAAALTWLCRDEIAATTTRPARAKSTRLDFLIGWVAVSGAAINVTAAAEVLDQRGLVILAGIVLYSVALIGGTLIVVSTTNEPWRRWIRGPASLAGLWLVSGLTGTLFYFGYIALLMTKWTVLGLTIGVGQWWAIRRWSWGVVWLTASAIGWTSSLWIPAATSALVGPANVWRYAVQPEGFHAVAGLATGLAFLWETRRGEVFTR